MPFKPIEPKEITEKYWKDNMGLAYKMAKGKAGLSEALRKAEKAMSSVKWDAMDPHVQCKDCMYDQEFDDQKNQALKYCNSEIKGKLKKVIEGIYKPCDTVIAQVKKSKVLPKSTRETAAKIKLKAEAYAKVLDSWPDQIASYFDDKKTRNAKNVAIAKVKLAKYINTFMKAMTSMLKAVKAADESDKISKFQAFRAEYIRGIGTSIPFFKKDPDFNKLLPFWRKASTDGYDPAESSQIPAKIKQLDAAHKQLKKVAENKGLI